MVSIQLLFPSPSLSLLTHDGSRGTREIRSRSNTQNQSARQRRRLFLQSLGWVSRLGCIQGLALGERNSILAGTEEPGTQEEDAAGMDNQPRSDPTRPVMKVPEAAPHILARGNPHIFVRSEYEKAQLAALVANTANLEVFLIFGQSGIGSPLAPHPHLRNLIRDQGKLCF